MHVWMTQLQTIGVRPLSLPSFVWPASLQSPLLWHGTCRQNIESIGSSPRLKSKIYRKLLVFGITIQVGSSTLNNTRQMATLMGALRTIGEREATSESSKAIGF